MKPHCEIAHKHKKKKKSDLFAIYSLWETGKNTCESRLISELRLSSNQSIIKMSVFVKSYYWTLGTRWE